MARKPPRSKRRSAPSSPAEKPGTKHAGRAAVDAAGPLLSLGWTCVIFAGGLAWWVISVMVEEHRKHGGIAIPLGYAVFAIFLFAGGLWALIAGWKERRRQRGRGLPEEPP